MRKLLTIMSALLVSAALFAQQSGGSADLAPYLEAVGDYSEGQFDSAKEKFEALLASNPEDDAVSYYLGMCEMMTGNPASAELHLQDAYQRDTTNEWYVYALANFYNNTGRRAQFADYCEKLLDMNPVLYSNPYMLSILGDVRLSQRRFTKALAHYDKALELDPTYAPADLGRMEALRMTGNNPAFFAAIDKVISNPAIKADVKSSYLEALVSGMTQNFYMLWGGKVEELVDKCLELHPLEMKAYLLKINLLSIRGDDEEAMEQCGKMASAASSLMDAENLALAYNLEGDIAYSLGDMRRTYKAYDKALKINPDLCSVLNNYAYFLSLEKRSLGKALRMSRRTVELEPDNATYLDTLGWILFLKGRAEEAKPLFKKAMIYGGKDSVEVLTHYSQVLEALGEDDLAQYYRRLAEQKSR